MKEIRINTRINEELRDDLLEIAAEEPFEGNFSQVVRQALREFRDRRRRRGTRPHPAPSS